MADYSITAANVAWVSGTPIQLSPAVANESMTAGQAFYFDNSNSQQAKKSDANASGKDGFDGIVMQTSVSSGQYFAYAPPGAVINPGCNMTPTDVVILSTNAGGLAPVADLASGSNLTLVGVALATTQLYIQKYQSSVTKP